METLDHGGPRDVDIYWPTIEFDPTYWAVDFEDWGDWERKGRK